VGRAYPVAVEYQHLEAALREGGPSYQAKPAARDYNVVMVLWGAFRQVRRMLNVAEWLWSFLCAIEGYPASLKPADGFQRPLAILH
jgi:hypothetical protein